MSNTKSFALLTDDEIEEEFNRAIREDEEDDLENGIPLARYDEVRKQGYLLYADGRREYV